MKSCTTQTDTCFAFSTRVSLSLLLLLLRRISASFSLFSLLSCSRRSSSSRKRNWRRVSSTTFNGRIIFRLPRVTELLRASRREVANSFERQKTDTMLLLQSHYAARTRQLEAALTSLKNLEQQKYNIKAELAKASFLLVHAEQTYLTHYSGVELTTYPPSSSKKRQTKPLKKKWRLGRKYITIYKQFEPVFHSNLDNHPSIS